MLNKSVKFIKKNRKEVIIGAIVLAVLIACGFGYNAVKERQYQQQWAGLFMADLSFITNGQNPSVIEDFVAQNADNAAGVYGALTLGNAYYQTGDYAKAEAYFKQVMASRYQDLAAIAQSSLIAVFVANKQYSEAVGQADSFIAARPAHFALAQVQLYKALAQDYAGQKTLAKAAYEQFGQDYPNTYYSILAQERLKGI